MVIVPEDRVGLVTKKFVLFGAHRAFKRSANLVVVEVPHRKFETESDLLCLPLYDAVELGHPLIALLAVVHVTGDDHRKRVGEAAAWASRSRVTFRLRISHDLCVPPYSLVQDSKRFFPTHVTPTFR